MWSFFVHDCSGGPVLRGSLVALLCLDTACTLITYAAVWLYAVR
jgi:hypothetical protein